MGNTNKIVAIIPARGGSKGIAGKNLIDLCGKPLLVWTIEQALSVDAIDSVWVTSDSAEILRIGEATGAHSIERPSFLSTDEASSESAWIHALDVIEQKMGSVDLVVGMQATSPLREARDIENALKIFQEEKLDSLFSASRADKAFRWSRLENGQWEGGSFNDRKRRQELPAEYSENGSFYLFRPQLLRANGNRLSGRIGLVEMEYWKSFQIDSLSDLDLCTAVMKHYLGSQISCSVK